jgi:uncharacterized protein YukE
MTNIWVDPEMVRTVAEELKIPAGTVESAWQKFMARAAELGRPWGDDDIGKEFAKEYDPVLLNFDTSMRSIVEHFVNLSKALGATGGAYLNVEVKNQS